MRLITPQLSFQLQYPGRIIQDTDQLYPIAS